MGISPYATNLVFIAYSIAKMVASPLAGALASRIGRRSVLIGGVVTVSGTCVVFGLVPDLVGGRVAPMVALMTGVRVLQGVGMSCAQVATFAILSDAFPENRGLVTGSAIGCLGLGWSIGPPVGGLLYVAGGFRLPFVGVGLLPLLFIGPLLLLSPRPTGTPSPTGSVEAEGDGPAGKRRGEGRRILRRVLGHPDVWLGAFTAFAYMSKWGWWDIQFTMW